MKSDLHEINGNKYWYKEGLLHRENGPAVEYNNGTKIWMINNKIHRLDGPAIIRNDGSKSWFINNVGVPCSSQEEFERLIKLKAFW